MGLSEGVVITYGLEDDFEDFVAVFLNGFGADAELSLKLLRGSRHIGGYGLKGFLLEDDVGRDAFFPGFGEAPLAEEGGEVVVDVGVA